MSWWMLAPTVLGAIQGQQQADAQRDDQKANNLAQAELTRYSPWTGMKGQLDMKSIPSGQNAAIAGGMQGFAMGQSLGLGGEMGAKPDYTKNMDNGQKSIANGLMDDKNDMTKMWSQGSRNSYRA